MKKNVLILLFLVTAIGNAQIVSIPDANFKIKLLGAASTNTIAKNLEGNFFKIDANNDGEIQQSEANNVSELALNLDLNGQSYKISSVIGITNFTNLTRLDLRNNKIVTLNISGLAYLTFIDCSNNSQYLASLSIENLPLLETLNCLSAGSNVTNPTYSFLNLPSLKTIRANSCRFYSNTLDNIISLENFYGISGFKSTVTALDLSNKPNLKIVELNNNNLQTLTLANNNTIQTLKLAGNSLTTFNKNLFTDLQILDLSWNKLNSLDVSGMTSLADLNVDNASTSFTYDFTSLNVQGCTNLYKLICSRNVLSDLNLNGLTNLYLLDAYGNNDIFTNTGLQAIHLQNCSSLKKVIVHSNPYITELDLSCSSGYTEIRVQDCTNLQRINLKNGANDSAMYAGLFSYQFTPNLTLVVVDFNENYTFLPTTIQQSPYYNFTPNCSYNTVMGTVKFDIEGDGCQNNSGVQGIKMQYNCSLPECYTFSDNQGNFILYTQSNSISITPQNDLYPLFDFGLSGPVVLNFDENTILQNIDLCLAPNTVTNDVEITVLPIEQARPGFDTTYKIAYKNKGNQIESGTINLTFEDAVMDWVTSNPTTTASENNLQWSFSNLLPFETRTTEVTFNINSPMENPPIIGGSILNFSGTITASPLDVNQSNNTSTLSQTVVNSFDPNNIICIEGKSVSPNNIGGYVNYIINFENNGTANAQNIVVRNAIDATKFDITSLTPVASSNNVITRTNENNEVEFIFQNINLPFDDANNDGYIAYKIKLKPTLVLGDTFSNLANIYFDYNYPIVTNNFISTIENNLGTQENDAIPALLVYPNPTKETLFFNTKSIILKVEVYDSTGRLLISDSKVENGINISSLNTGNYIVKIYSDKENSTIKVIKQ